MTVKSIVELIIEAIKQDRAGWAVIILLAMTVIQISPIKLDPWTKIANFIERGLNKMVLEKVDKIGKKVDLVEEKLNNHILESESSALQQKRSDILSFGSSIISGKNYNKEKFDFMISCCDEYEKYCHENKVANGVADATIKEIRRIYSVRLSEGSFLREGQHNDI